VTDWSLLASGDIRNIVKTLASLPENFHGKCNFVVNDKDFDVVSRNVMLLLTSLHYEPSRSHSDVDPHVVFSFDS